VTSIGEEIFGDCKSLVSATIGTGITCISGWAFLNCISLKAISIPESVTEIGVVAFGGCKVLRSITIPKSVTKIGSSALTCYSLEDIYCYASVPPVTPINKNYNYKSVTLHVPAEYMWYYKVDPVWKKYKIKAIK